MNKTFIIGVGALIVALSFLLFGHMMSAKMTAAGPSAGGYSILGCINTGSRSADCEAQVDPVTIPAGSTATIWSIPAPLPVSNEQFQITAMLNGGAISGCSGAAACNGWVRRQLVCTYANGSCLDSARDASDLLLGIQLPTIIADAGSALSVNGDGSAIVLNVTCPAGGPTCSIGASISYTPVFPYDGGQFDSSTPG